MEDILSEEHVMYSLYDCDAWRSTSSMRVEYETLDRLEMDAKIEEILLSDPEAFELINYLSSDEQDEFFELKENDIDFNEKDFWKKKLEQLPDKYDSFDLAGLVDQQKIDYLYLKVRDLEPDLKNLSDEDYSRISNTKTVKMYSLYDCDAWCSWSSLRLNFETIDRKALNDRLKQMFIADPEAYDLQDIISADEHGEVKVDDASLKDLVERQEVDDLVDIVQKQLVNFLYLEIREIKLDDETVELVG